MPDDDARDAEILDEVLRLRIDGAQPHEILSYCRDEKKWVLGPRDVARYVRRADQALARRPRSPRPAVLALAVARREALYARAVTSGDYGAALAVLKDLGSLQLIYPKDRAAELVQLVQAQAARIRELEAAADGPVRRLAAGAPPAEEGSAGKADDPAAPAGDELRAEEGGGATPERGR